MVAAATISMAVGRVHESAKFDLALETWAKHPTTPSVRTLIRVRPGTARQVAERLAWGSNADGFEVAPDLLVAELSPGGLRAASVDGAVTNISLDARVQSFATSSANLSQNDLIQTEALLSTPYTGANVGVAVIDSGFLPSADLGNVTASYTFTSGKAVKQGPKDAFGHGTHVSGLIGSTGSTSSGQYRGIAPGSRFIVLRALDDTGSGYTSNVIAALNFAIANRKTFGIDIINMSLGHPIYEPAGSDPLVAAVQAAVDAGIVVVVSAGNFGGDPATHVSGYGGITSPANSPGAITVGALDTHQTPSRSDDEIAWYSSRGPTWYDGFQKPDIVAPGSHLVSDVPSSCAIASKYPGGLIKTSGTCKLTKLSGTSMAAGVVSGVVSLMLEANRKNHPGGTLTPNAVKAILEYTAFPVGSSDPLTQGAGALNAAGAVTLAAAIDATQPAGAWWLATPITPSTVVAGRIVRLGPAPCLGRAPRLGKSGLHKRSRVGSTSCLG
jgi:serine protease AprX